jgi:hypothetical protein
MNQYEYDEYKTLSKDELVQLLIKSIEEKEELVKKAIQITLDHADVEKKKAVRDAIDRCPEHW